MHLTLLQIMRITHETDDAAAVASFWGATVPALAPMIT
jgi:hypothetical protein